MIVNDQQLGVVATQLADLEEWRDRLLNATDRSAFEVHTVVSGIERMMARLQREMNDYQSTKAGDLPSVLTARVKNEHLGQVAEALIRLRVANGMSVEDAARVVGRCPSSMGPWEDEEYKGYTLRELATLAAALGRELQISFAVPDSAGRSEEFPEAKPESEPLAVTTV
jgi:hypothetical protein